MRDAVDELSANAASGGLSLVDVNREGESKPGLTVKDIAAAGNVNITLPGYWKGKVSTDGLEVVSTDAGSNSYTLKVGGKGYGFFFVK